MDSNWSICSIGLFALDAFDVNYKLLSVDLHHFSNCVTLVVTADNLNKTSKTKIVGIDFDDKRESLVFNTHLHFIIFTDWHVAYIVLGFQFL